MYFRRCEFEMKTVFKNSFGIILIDIGYILLSFLPQAQQAGFTLILLGCSLAIMTALTFVRNWKAEKNNGKGYEENPIMKVFYYIGVILAVAGLILLILKRLL